MDDGADPRPIGSVFSEAISRLALLVRVDLRLLQAEMKAKTAPIASSGAFGAAAVIFFVLAAFALVQFLVLAVIHFGVAPMFACLIIGMGLLAAGLVSLYMARRALIGWTITPVETVNQVRTDLAALKQGVNYGSTQR